VNRSLEIVPYDRLWPDQFEAEARRVGAALGEGALRVDHVGSTAVPGLAAKPVIDLQVSVPALEPMDTYRRPLAQLGYTHVPHPDDAVYPFFHRPTGWPHTHHIHVCCTGSEEERRHLAFRDYLRDHDELSREYERVKRRLATQFSAETFESRNAYAEAKSGFIEPLIQRALAEGYPRRLRA
jgi:GrpB-like predicted nucleotidyltransferase (UPF0157 family)